MQINDTMDLGQLNDRAQNELTSEQCETLRDLLVESGHENTEDVPETEWLEMLEQAAQ